MRTLAQFFLEQIADSDSRAVIVGPDGHESPPSDNTLDWTTSNGSVITTAIWDNPGQPIGGTSVALVIDGQRTETIPLDDPVAIPRSGRLDLDVSLWVG